MSRMGREKLSDASTGHHRTVAGETHMHATVRGTAACANIVLAGWVEKAFLHSQCILNALNEFCLSSSFLFLFDSRKAQEFIYPSLRSIRLWCWLARLLRSCLRDVAEWSRTLPNVALIARGAAARCG